LSPAARWFINRAGFHQNPVGSSAFVEPQLSAEGRNRSTGEGRGAGAGPRGGVARCWKFCGINFAPSTAELSAGKFRHCPAACKFSHYVEGDDLRRRIPTRISGRGNVFAEGDVFSAR